MKIMFEEDFIAEEKILCSAIMYKGRAIAGRRHNDCYDTLLALVPDEKDLPGRDDQGFLTTHNRYVSREDAWAIATEHNQIVVGENLGDPNEPDMLISENLY
jgi:hypothetical protein